MNYNARRNSTIALGMFSAVGTILTAILVAKETPKALKKIEVLKKKDSVSKFDYIKELLPVYWPAILLCAGTVASTTISNVISRKTEASLLATTAMLNQGWNKYRYKVKELFGVDADRLINTKISEEDYSTIKPELKNKNSGLYWEEHVGFFRCDPVNLMSAITDLNQRLHTPDPSPDGTFYWTTLYKFLMDAEAEVFDKERLESVKNIGWTTDYLCSKYELHCMWVHPFYTAIIDRETGEVLYVKVSFYEDPILLLDKEMSRFDYKSREDFEHEAEIDMFDPDAFGLYSHGFQDVDTFGSECKVNNIQKAFINSKPDCNIEEDDGRRFIPSNPSQMMAVDYLDNDNELPPKE